MRGSPYREIRIPPGDELIQNPAWLLSREHLDANCNTRYGGKMPAKPPMEGAMPLFDPPAAAPPPGTRDGAADSGRAQWSHYKSRTRMPCDHCKQAQAEGTLTGVASQATWRRRDGGEELLLCYLHADPLMRDDGYGEARR